MLERLVSRTTRSVLGWDVIATVVCLFIAVNDKTSLVHQWPLYSSVALIWTLIFVVLAPQRALFTCTLLEAFTRLSLSIVLAATSFAGLLYLVNGSTIDRVTFVHFVVLDLIVLTIMHLGFRTLAYWRQQRGNGRAGGW